MVDRIESDPGSTTEPCLDDEETLNSKDKKKLNHAANPYIAVGLKLK